VDILTHAAVGAATGFAFGHPVVGALVAVAPDVVLGIRRRDRPTRLYNITHSLVFLFGSTLLFALSDVHGEWTALVYWCLFSHIVLDIPTHGPVWAPPLLYPFSEERFDLWGDEWEFGNQSWRFGLGLAVVWSALFIWFGV
jgi:hypothetical protein